MLKKADLGFDEIRDETDLIRFYDKAQEVWPEMAPLSLGNRGFHFMNMNDMYLRTKGVYDISGWPVWNFPDKIILDTSGEKVLDVVFAGDDSSRFQTLGWDSIFLSDFLLKNASLSKYVQPHSMLSKSQDELFSYGKSVSMEGQLSECSLDVESQVRRYDDLTEVAFGSYEWVFNE